MRVRGSGFGSKVGCQVCYGRLSDACCRSIASRRLLTIEGRLQAGHIGNCMRVACRRFAIKCRLQASGVRNSVRVRKSGIRASRLLAIERCLQAGYIGNRMGMACRCFAC